MKIGIDIRSLGTKHLTGIGKYIFHSIENILKIDNKNKYYLFSSGLDKGIYSYPEFDRENVEHIHFPVSNKLINFRVIAGMDCKLCNDFFKSTDVFWMPNINFCNFDKAKNTILTIHDLSFLHSREFYSLKRRYWHRLLQVDKLVKKASHIITVSENTKRDLMRFYSLPDDKISIIYPGIDYKPLDQDTASNLLKDLSLPEKFFVYVGTIEPRKNIMSIIKAFDRYNKEYPDVHLAIVGSKGWIYQKLLYQIKKRSYVHYLDYVSSPLKDALYYKSLGLIWPSFYEGFGFPPMEATAHSCPTIVSYKTSLPEICKQQALYVDPYNVSDIYHNLKILTEDKELRDKFKKSAAQFDLPSWHRQSEKILEIFNKYKK